MVQEPWMDYAHTIRLTINGRSVRRFVEPRLNAADFIRHELGLTGTHVGCEHGVCGACSIVVDHVVVRGCLMFAVQLDGSVVETIEGATEARRVEALQIEFVERNALQCGFCTPGMILTAAEFLSRKPAPSRLEVRSALSGNLCRCTGYEAIVDAVMLAAERLR
jgi:carbon-monoxide dehydrogenase small subunit